MRENPLHLLLKLYHVLEEVEHERKRQSDWTEFTEVEENNTSVLLLEAGENLSFTRDICPTSHLGNPIYQCFSEVFKHHIVILKLVVAALLSLSIGSWREL